MTIRVDPREVLAHLNQMGFCNVSAKQLEEFIGDLKKLVKYDLQQCKSHKSKGPRTPIVCERDECDAGCACMSSSDQFLRERETERDEYTSGNADVSEQTESNYFYTSSSTSSYETSSSRSRSESCQRPVESCPQKDKSSKNYTTKPRSSFIKSWHLQVSANQRRSDPVTLYHKYSSLWQKQKVPGYSNHDTLRWNVREKMLGGDPYPRPVR